MFEIFEMMSSRITTPLVVDITQRACPNFKKYPVKFVEDDPLGAFSFVAYGFLHVEDIRVYIHVNIVELGSSQMVNFYSTKLLDENCKLKPKFKLMEEKGFSQFIKFPTFNEHNWV